MLGQVPTWKIVQTYLNNALLRLLSGSNYRLQLVTPASKGLKTENNAVTMYSVGKQNVTFRGWFAKVFVTDTKIKQENCNFYML